MNASRFKAAPRDPDSTTLDGLRAALRQSPGPVSDAASGVALLRALSRDGFDRLPLPGAGRTLDRWRALAAVAEHDLSLAKLFEGHTDALAILAEAGQPEPKRGQLWGMWAAEPPQARVTFRRDGEHTCTVSGTKAWCSGARHVDAGLLTVWSSDGQGPFLAAVTLDQPGIRIDASSWRAVGMQASDSVSVAFDAVPARLIGRERFYLERPGFWQGGIGVAACWHGGASALANALWRNVQVAGDRAGWHRQMALGAVDALLSANAALLREAAAWVDANPGASAQALALRARAATDATCERVLERVTHALGAGPLCLDAAVARTVADLPIFIRQCHAERDLAALGESVVGVAEGAWTL